MACTFQEGNGSPVGAKTPNFIGQLYYDTTGHEYWRSTGTTNSDWIFVGGVSFVTWSPSTAVATWTDGNGAGQTGDLPTFTANAELSTLSNLNLDSTGITTLTARYCPLLSFLTCQLNNLTSLDMKGCDALNTVQCSFNSLTSLDLSTNHSLTALSCDYNSIINLDLSGHAPLRDLICSYNSLLTLDLSGCSSVVLIHCDNNSLTVLDISPCLHLQNINAFYNSLSTLDFTPCLELVGVLCNNNAMTSLTGLNSTVLNGLNATNNNLTTGVGGAINIVLTDILSSEPTPVTAGSFIDLSLQTPAAPPDAGPPDGATAKATLIANGWLVTTD